MHKDDVDERKPHSVVTVDVTKIQRPKIQAVYQLPEGESDYSLDFYF